MKDQIPTECTEHGNNYIIKVKRPGLKYLTEFVRCTCSSDLLKLRYFPNAKEITESFGAYNAVRTHLQNIYAFDDPEVRVVVVGDGTKPRTGATFAFRSNWTVYSIDPNLFKNKLQEGEFLHFPDSVKRLSAYRSKIEKLEYINTYLKDEILYNIQDKKLIIVCVHSHAKLSDCITKLKTRKKNYKYL